MAKIPSKARIKRIESPSNQEAPGFICGEGCQPPAQRRRPAMGWCEDITALSGQQELQGAQLAEGLRASGWA
jgi:hypothetical protein